jgi:hypothetical protein
VLDSLREKVPEEREHHIPIKITFMPGKFISHSEGHPHFGDYDFDTHSIRIASGRSLPKAQDKPNIGGWKVGEDFRTVLTHEFGHSLTNRILKAAGDVSLKELYDSQPKNYWQKNVSQYGATQPAELIAEAFAAYVHPNYSGGLAPEFVRLFKAARIDSNIIENARETPMLIKATAADRSMLVVGDKNIATAKSQKPVAKIIIALDEQHYKAIAIPYANGWRRLVDTKFATERRAREYGDRYHGSLGRHYKIVDHPDVMDDETAKIYKGL